MHRRLSLTFLFIVAAGYSMHHAAFAQAGAASVPRFQVDASWPKMDDNIWLFGAIGGIAVDPTNDHVFVLQRPKSLSEDELHATFDPPLTDCCVPAPPVMEFDPAGHLLGGWGGDGPGYEWPASSHGISIDYKGNVWIGGGNGQGDAHVLKFTKTGKFLLQIGHRGKAAGSNDTVNMGRPTKAIVYPKTNEVFVSDGYDNRRVIVFDADTGQYKRHWGAYGKRPDDSATRDRILEGPTAPQQFNNVHSLAVSNDGLIYAADRVNNRVQVFQPDGTFVKEGFVARKTLFLRSYSPIGTVCDLAFSPDPKQQFMYVADCINYHVWILQRDTLQVLGKIGREGRNAGLFYHLHMLAADTKGNIYTGEVEGKRVQKFLFRSGARTSRE
jgi:DNA-binding beta-propeller fold protein YncE